MKKTFTPVKVLCLVFIGLFISGSQLVAQCTNADFENGTFSNWTGTYSLDSCGIDIIGVCACQIPAPTQISGFDQGPNNNLVSDPVNHYEHIITTTAGGNDPNVTSLGGTLPVAWTGSGNYSARIGSMWQEIDSAGTGGDGETISYSYTVTAATCNFTYHYAVVINDGGHPPGQQPYFNIKMSDGGGNDIACADYEVDATTASTIGGFTQYTNSKGEPVYVKQWTSVFIPLNNYIGQTVKITFTARGCSPGETILGLNFLCEGSHYCYAYIDAECGPLALVSSSPTVCGGTGVTLSAPAGAATYSWSGSGIVGPTNGQTVTINQGGGRDTVVMTTFGNTPCTFFLDTIIPASPNSPSANFSVGNTCEGSPTTFTDLSTPNSGQITNWAWDFNNTGTTQSTSQNPSYTFPSAGTYPVTLTVTWAPCTADTTIDVVIGPPPTSTFTATSPVCAGQASTITYTGNGTGADTYTWNFNGGTVISGTGAGPYQVNWAVAGTKNITLTVSAGTCASTLTTVPVTVTAFPGLTLSPDTAICAGGSAPLTVSGATTYTWAPAATLNSPTNPSVIATPATTTTYTVTGNTASCTVQDIVTVTVNPVPTSTFTATGPICPGQNSTVTFTGTASGAAVYTWNFAGGTVASGAGQGPYTVNWPSGGTENITLSVTDLGCPSTLTTVPVTVNPQPTSTFTVISPVCIGSNSAITYTGNAIAGATYTWSFSGGTVASGAGQGPYQVSWATTGPENVTLSVTQNGCTSTLTTVPVLVTPIPTSPFTVVSPVCALQNSTITYTGNAPANSTYTWNFGGGTVVTGAGQGPYQVNWPTAGNENVTLSVSEGTCVSTLTTVPVVVNSTPTATFTVVSPLCTGQNSTITYTGSGTGAGAYTWGFAGGTVVTGAGSGPYTVNWATAGNENVTLSVTENGCSSNSTETVVVNAIPTSTFTATSPVCTGQNSTITYTGTGTAGATFTWTFAGGTVATGAGAGPYTVNWPTAGADSITLLVSQNGCTSAIDTMPVVVNAIPPSFAGDDTTFCSGDSATIGTAPTAGYTYTWNPASGLSDPTLANPVADLTNATSSAVSTTYTVTTSQNGCSSTDAAVVTVDPIPAPAYTVPAGECLIGNSFNFVAGGAFLPSATLTWNFGANATPLTSILSTQSVNFSTTGEQIVSLTVTQNGCANTFTDSVAIYAEPIAGFTPDSVLGCENFQVCFINTTVTTDSVSYFWNFGDSTTSMLGTPCHTYGPPGIYSVTLKVTTINGCESDTAAPNIIQVIADPKAIFTESANVVQIPHSAVAFLNQSKNAATYLWEFGTPDSSSTQVSPVYTFTDSGEYNIVLTAYNQLGCPDSTQQLVIVVPPDNFYIPNVFSPNGDGFNDEFYIYAQPGALVVSFKVFDRTGEKVHDGNYPWDGTFKGKPAPQGVYVYEVELGLVYETYTTIRKGSVTLLR